MWELSEQRGIRDDTLISNLDNECSQMACYTYQLKEEEEVNRIQITGGRVRLEQGVDHLFLWVKKEGRPDTLEVRTEEN